MCSDTAALLIMTLHATGSNAADAKALYTLPTPVERGVHDYRVQPPRALDGFELQARHVTHARRIRKMLHTMARFTVVLKLSEGVSAV
jgi:hypothetical protein